MKILNRKINKNNPPFIIAELSGNHKGSLVRALKIIDKAKEAGASAIKLQTFDLNEMTINFRSKDFIINDKSSPWYKKNLYQLYKKAQTPRSWHKKIFKYSKKIGIICFSSVFDLKSLAFLEKLNAPAYKIASFENNHFPLIEKVAATKKPVIISTGMARIDEIKEIVKIFKLKNNNNFALLKCTSSYPTNPKESNIIAIETLNKKFRCEVGLSDHTEGIGASVASIAVGASIIEKHIVLKKNDGSVDESFSLSPLEFKNLVNEANNAWLSLGKKYLGPTKNEKNTLKFRRSIYVIKNSKKGDTLSNKNIKIIRPSYGLHPKFFSRLIGKKFKKTVRKGMPFKMSMI